MKRTNLLSRRLVAVAVAAAVVAPMAAAVAVAPSAAAADSAPPIVVPSLREWSGGDGTLALPRSLRVVVSSADAQRDLGGRTVLQEADRLTADLVNAGFDAARVVGGSSEPGDVVMLAVDPSVVDGEEEGYRLTVDDRVHIDAATAAGLFYGGRTLLQSVAQGDGIPVGVATDAPSQGLRGGLLDTGRKYWSVDYLKDLIRRMSYQKLNSLNLHLVEAEGFRLDSPAFPGLADPASSYDETEIRDLVAFAAEYHVDIVPGFEFPGHTTVLSDYFGIGFGMGANACSGEHMHSHVTADWSIDMTSSKARADSAAILEEFVPWFDSPYVHLGGDELPGQLSSCQRVVDYIAAEPTIGSAGDMLVDFLNDLSETVTTQGKRPIIFNGFEHMPRQQQTLDEDIIIEDWQGDMTDPAFAGHDTKWMSSTSTYLAPSDYTRMYPDIDYLARSWRPSTAQSVLGSSFAVWADYMMWADDEFFEQQMGPLRAAVADRSWNAEVTGGSEQELMSRLAVIGDAPGVTGFTAPPRLGADEPVHRYSFEPTDYPSGWTAAGSAGQTLFVEDETGRLHGSTYIIDNPSFVDGGVTGKALNFSGDRQGVGFGGVDLEGPWTTTVWVKQDQASANATLLSSKAGIAVILDDAASGHVALADGAARHTFDYSLPVGRWVALGLVNDGSSTTLYVDGVEQDRIEATIDLPLKSIGGANVSLRGSLDELTIYDAARTADQIKADYDAIASVLPRPGLVNYWPLDETGDVALDVVGGDDADLHGAERGDAVVHGGLALSGSGSGLSVGASDIAGSWTASLWVKRTEPRKSAALFSGASSSIKLEQYDGTGKIGFTRFGVADDVIDYSAPLGEWVHLTFTNDGGEFRAYADGELVGRLDAPGALGRAWIGRLASGQNTDDAAAEVDEIMIFDRALSDAEVGSLFDGFAQTGGQPVDLDVSLAFSPSPAGELTEGDEVAVAATVMNPGLVDLADVSITGRDGLAGECPVVALLAAGERGTCALVYRVTAEDAKRATISLVADAAGVGTNPLATPVSAESDALTAAVSEPGTGPEPTTGPGTEPTAGPGTGPGGAQGGGTAGDPHGDGLAATGTDWLPIGACLAALALLIGSALVAMRRSRSASEPLDGEVP